MKLKQKNSEKNHQNVLVALDIGTTKVCTTIAQISEKNEIEVIGIGSSHSHGLKKGSVVNIEETIRSIESSVNEAKLMAGIEITSASVSIAGNHIYCFNSSGVVAVKGKEITEEDVKRAMDAAKAVVIPSDREILHVIPQEFYVDTTGGIRNPVGMCGMRLEVHVHIVTGLISLIQNLIKCVEGAGLNVNEIMLQPLASSKSVLSEEEKDLGVLLVDIGGGTTDLALWHNGSIIYSEIIPVGGNNFTNDLAVGLKITHNEAERVKIQHGSVLFEKINPTAHITIQGITGTRARDVSIQEISKILGARAEELFGLIKNRLSERHLEHLVNGGIILTGGGALLNNLTELGEYILERPVKIGIPSGVGGMTSVMLNPKYSTVLGLLIDAKISRAVSNSHLTKNSEVKEDIMVKLKDSLKSVFNDLF